MPLYLGGTAATRVYVGGTPATRVYHGTKLIWPVTANVGGTTVSLSEVDSSHVFDQTVPVTTTTTNVPIPLWVKTIDVLAVGGGAGASGSTSLANGSGGQGGVWNAATLSVEKLLLDGGITGEPRRIYASVTVGAGGTGGPGNLLTLQAGQAGKPTVVEIYAEDSGGVVRKLNTLTALQGNPITPSIGPVATGQAVRGGNANSGKDYTLNGRTYVGGGTVTTNNAGQAPGGGGAGSSAGGTTAGRPGANGQAWLRMTSGSASSQLSWFTPGTFSTDFPLDTDFIFAAALGGGGGGGGAPFLVGGTGGAGGRWAYYRPVTPTPLFGGAESVDALLTAAGLTRAKMRRLFATVVVGSGGKGGPAGGLTGTVGTNGTESSVTLSCVTDTGATVVLRSKLAGAGGASAGSTVGINNEDGAAAGGGNTTPSGGSSGQAVTATVNGRNYTFTGGGRQTVNGAKGFAPGGGGAGGNPAGAGGDGANGAVHIVFI